MPELRWESPNMTAPALDYRRFNGDNDLFFFVICIAMHICFGQQSYYYISHATCVCAWMHVWGCQGLGRGLVPTWIKSRWRPWRGRKPPVSHILVFYSDFTCILPMAAWHVRQGRLGFILECIVACKTKTTTKPSALLCTLFFLWWCYQTSYGTQVMLACIKVTSRITLEWTDQNSTNSLLIKIMHVQITSKETKRTQLFGCGYHGHI